MSDSKAKDSVESQALKACDLDITSNSEGKMGSYKEDVCRLAIAKDDDRTADVELPSQGEQETFPRKNEPHAVTKVSTIARTAPCSWGNLFTEVRNLIQVQGPYFLQS